MARAWIRGRGSSSSRRIRFDRGGPVQGLNHLRHEGEPLFVGRRQRGEEPAGNLLAGPDAGANRGGQIAPADGVRRRQRARGLDGEADPPQAVAAGIGWPPASRLIEELADMNDLPAKGVSIVARQRREVDRARPIEQGREHGIDVAAVHAQEARGDAVHRPATDAAVTRRLDPAALRETADECGLESAATAHSPRWGRRTAAPSCGRPAAAMSRFPARRTRT